jgi:hypothetical protein
MIVIEGKTMGTKILIISFVTLLLVGTTQAREWLIKDGDVYSSSYIEINTGDTLTMTGGLVTTFITAYGNAQMSFSGGELATLFLWHMTHAEIVGGVIGTIHADADSGINLYAHNVTYENELLSGFYNAGNIQMSVKVDERSFTHVNIIPEPLSVTLLGTGMVLFLNKRRIRR